MHSHLNIIISLFYIFISLFLISSDSQLNNTGRLQIFEKCNDLKSTFYHNPDTASKDSSSVFQKKLANNIKSFSDRKCPICNKSIRNRERIVRDFWGNVYHYAHLSQYQNCYSCGRLIHQGLTGTTPFQRGGKTLSDGRGVCNTCIKSGSLVFYPIQAEKLLIEVLDNIREFGIDIPNIYRIALVDEKEMAEMRQHELRPGERNPAITSLSISKSMIQNNTTYKTQCTIYELIGMHKLFFKQCLAHELMHVWIFVNCQYGLTLALTEGTCNYLSYLVLQSEENTEYKRYYINLLETNRDPIYGEGFRKVKRSVAKFGDFETFLTYIRYNSDFPN